MTIHPRRFAGFSLVEITIAMGILAFVLLSIIGLLGVGLNSGRSAQIETAKVSAARFVLTSVQTNDPGTLSGSNLWFNYDGMTKASSNEAYFQCVLRNEFSGGLSPRVDRTSHGIQLSADRPRRPPARQTRFMQVSSGKIEVEPRYHAAFTLIEVLVGATIFMLMAVLLMTVLSQINNAWQQVQGQKARRECADCLRIAQSGPPGNDSRVARSRQQCREFSAPLQVSEALPAKQSFGKRRFRSAVPKSDVATVGYFLSEDYKLYRIYTNSPVNGFQSATNTMGGTNDSGLVAENILRMTVSLINKDGSTNAATTNYETNLPSAADITLLVSDARTLLQHPTLGVPDVNNPPSGVQVFRTRIDIPAGQ